MAKNKNQTQERKSTYYNAYIFAAILLFLVVISNMLQTSYLYGNNNKIMRQTSNTMNCINQINANLQTVNLEVTSLMGNVGVPAEHAAKIGPLFEAINAQINRFESFEYMPDNAKRRFKYAKTYLNSYNSQLKEVQSLYQQIQAEYQNPGPQTAENIKKIGSQIQAKYTQDVTPMQVSAQQMLLACIEIVNADTQQKQSSLRTAFVSVEIVMASVLLAGELSILLIARYAAKVRRDLEEREKNLQEVGARLKSTRQKASDLAVTNVLTGMKNRYALDNDVAERLESDRFNIAVFDMDNFRIINDTYGYDFGDEYLAAVSEKLKAEFSDVAEIYNITGNEFCFIFNRDITESQAMNLVQNIQAVMSSPYTVLNLSVQLTVSGAMYHYLPGDCLNVNSLLVKLDTTMRNAKMNGGNMINTVVNM